jgi:hypothetical protein
MSDIFREVDEEVRQDRALALWTRYQNWIIAAAVLVVVATAGWRLYESRRQAAAEASGSRYEAAVQASNDGKSAESLSILDALSRDGMAGYRQLAALRAADETATADPAKAVAVYDAFANGLGDPLLRDAARLRAAMAALDSGQTKDAQTRLLPLSNADSPFRNSARELLAVAALSDNNLDEAGKWLDSIVTDPSAPTNMRQRADAFLALVRSGRKPGK